MRTQELDIDLILQACIDLGASDLHISCKDQPFARIHGEMTRLKKFPVLTELEVKTMIYGIINDDQIRCFETDRELDCSYSINQWRFRVNISRDLHGVSAVFRVIPNEIPTLEKLNLPAVLSKISDAQKGLILVTGPTGSGKSTTLAAMIDRINHLRKFKIITLEDPIEYAYKNDVCQINQRELGQHTHQLPEGLRRALRQDPDVILVGEMRDMETIQLALTAAETGHLVFSTIHTNSAAETINRIVDVFPSGQQNQVRTQLADSLEAIICQKLIIKKEGNGRVAATEIMVAIPAVRANIRKPTAASSITSIIQTSAHYGMQTMDQSLLDLYRKNQITYDTVINSAANPDEIKQMMMHEPIK